MSNIIIKLKKIRTEGTNEKHISNYILNNIENIENIDIRDLAKKVNSSPSQITRFIKKLDYDSFIEFKYDIKTYNKNKSLDSNSEFNTLSNLIETNLNSLVEELKRNSSIWVKDNKIDLIVEELKGADRIFIFANGGMYSIAYDFTLKLQRLGFYVTCSNDFVLQETLISANNSKKKNCFIIFSSSGETTSLIKIAKKINEDNLTLISFTGEHKNTIEKLSNFNIGIHSTKNDLKSLIGTNRMAFLFFTNILFELLVKSQKNNFIDSVVKTAK